MLLSVVHQPKVISFKKSLTIVLILHLIVFRFLSIKSKSKSFNSLHQSTSIPQQRSQHSLDMKLRKFNVQIMDNDIIEVIKNQQRRTEENLVQKPDKSEKTSEFSRGDTALESIYLKNVIKHLSKYKHYPESERRREREGSATVTFQIHPDGSVSDISIRRSSAYKLLDEAALQTVQNAVPFPTLKNVDKSIKINVFIDFRLNE
ncbi:MAG: energy transducer TonB [Brevinema sp.]